MSPSDDATINRIKLYGGLGFAVLAAGFAAAMFLFTHYASAEDVAHLDTKVDEVSKKTDEHGVRIDSMHEDLRYIRDAVDDLRRRR